MPTKAILGLAVALIAGVSFFAGLLVERHWLAARPEAKVEPNREDRRREAFLQYLDGKTIDLKGPNAAADKKGTPHTIRKEQVQSVQFPASFSTALGDPQGPWRPEVNLILNTGEGRYFVRCIVPFRDVQDSFAFLGLEILEVVKQ
jgi:hypothetical protein